MEQKLKDFTNRVKLVIDDLYREGSEERNGIRHSEIVNTFALLEISDKLDKIIDLLSVEEPKKVEAPKAPTKTATK
jgi:hypothetical protein